jgi:hypothetical protein
MPTAHLRIGMCISKNGAGKRRLAQARPAHRSRTQLEGLKGGAGGIEPPSISPTFLAKVEGSIPLLARGDLRLSCRLRIGACVNYACVVRKRNYAERPAALLDMHFVGDGKWL